MIPKWVPVALVVALTLFAGNCWRQEGRHAAERAAWRTERAALLQSVDSVVALTTASLHAATVRESTLVDRVARLDRQVGQLARKTDSVRIVTVGALTPDASVSDSLQAYKALTGAMDRELNGVPGDSTQIGLRQAFARQQAAFVELTASHAALRADVASLQVTLGLTKALLERAPVKGPCKVPLVPVSCEAALLLGAVILSR